MLESLKKCQASKKEEEIKAPLVVPMKKKFPKKIPIIIVDSPVQENIEKIVTFKNTPIEHVYTPEIIQPTMEVL